MIETSPSLSRLTWQGHAMLPADVRDALTGVGAPFEMVAESIGGHEHIVFKSRPKTLREMLDTQAGTSPHAPFLVSPDRQWTYEEALEDIDALAVLLTKRYDITAGDRVAIVAANYAEYVLLMWATVSIGGIVVSLNGWWTAPELAYGVALSAPAIIVGDARRLDRLDPETVPRDVPVRLLEDLYDEAQFYKGVAASAPAITEDSPAIILFTSGTTGRPKGATLSHRNIINFASITRLGAATAAAMTPASATPTPAPLQTCVIMTSPLFHISGMVGALISGAISPTKMVFPAPGAWDPEVWFRLTAQHKVTTWTGVPTQYWRILRHPGIDDYDLSSVRTVGGGGAVFPPELIRSLHERFPSVQLGSGYGMSETVGVGTQAGGALWVAAPDSVGGPAATVDVEIRDIFGTVVPEGVVGEIHLRTPSVFLGYWDNPTATEEVLDKNRWYRTGDFGRVHQGLLFLESRRQDMILRGGENIYPIEIENRLIDHPDIDEAAVIGVDHRELGQEPKAFVVPRIGSGLTADDVREWCAAALAAYKVPTHVEFRDSLPYTETGKLLKSQLIKEEQAAAQA
jgi:acyl-CoA synthetase (AMP-forming)/AMP-acid ligase II